MLGGGRLRVIQSIIILICSVAIVLTLRRNASDKPFWAINGKRNSRTVKAKPRIT